MKTKSFKIILFIIFVFVTTIINAQTVTSTEVFTVGTYRTSDISNNLTFVTASVIDVNNGNGLSKTLEKQVDGSFTLVNTFDLLKGSGSSDAVNGVCSTITNLGTSFIAYDYGWSGDDGLIRLQKNLPDGSSVTIFEYVNDGIATMKAIGNDLYCVFGAGSGFDPGTLGGLPNLSGGYYFLKVNGTTNQYEWSTFLGNSFVWNFDIEIIENPNDPDNVYLTWANGDLQKFSKSNGADLGSVKSGNNAGDKYKFDENGNLNLLTQLAGYNGATLLIYDKDDNFNSVIYKTDWHQANLWNYGMNDWRILNGMLYGVNGGRNFHLDDKLIHGYICNQTSNIDSYGSVMGQSINDDGSYSYIMVNNSIINIVTATYPGEDQSLTPTLNDSDPNIVAVVDGQIYDGTDWVDAYHQGTIVFADGTLPAIGDTPDASWVNVPAGTWQVVTFDIEADERSGNLIFRTVCRKNGTASDDINLKVILESDVTLPESYSLSIEKTSDGSENGDDLVFTINISPVNNSGSTITGNITYSGSATEGVDYNGVSTFSIPDGSSSAVINLTVNDDTDVEGTETVIATISSLSNGNLGTDNASADIFDNDDSSGVESIEDNAISVYPNPVSDVLYISSEFDINSVKIYDIAGKLCFQKNLVPSSSVSFVSVSNLKTGVYFVRFLIDGHLVVKKIIKK